MKITLSLITLFVSLYMPSVFAGEMKKIDYAAREAVAETYFNPQFDNDFYEFMYSDIWNVKLEKESVEGCFVVVSGFTTSTFSGEREEVEFNVCINKDGRGDYTGSLL